MANQAAGDRAGLRLAAAALSLVIPGGGHALRGRVRRGLAWFAACTALVYLMPWTGRLGFLAAFTVRTVAVALDAALVRSGPRLTAGRIVAICLTLFAAMIALVVVFRTQLMSGYRVPSAGMAPNLAIGDLFYVDLRDRDGDLGAPIVFRPPGIEAEFIQRVVGVAGDRIAIRDGALWRNGNTVTVGSPTPCRFDSHDGRGLRSVTATCREERLGGHRYQVVFDPTLEFPSPDDAEVDGLAANEIVIPAGYVFALGDNRPDSNDSRQWGLLPTSRIVGTARYTWMSIGPHGVRWSRVLHAIE